MDLSIAELSILFAAAVLAGFVDSIAGGGGIITVPALLAVGVPPHLALGTNKLQSSFGSLTAALNYRRAGMMRFRDLTVGIIFTAIGAFGGTRTIQMLSPDLLEHLIPILLLGIFFYMLFNPKVGDSERPQMIQPFLFYLIFGCIIGFYDGFFGPGTGSFWTISFAVVLGLNLKSATAHTKVLNFTSNIVALTTFLAAGQVLLLAGTLMGCGQAMGAYLGSHLVLKRGTRFIRIFFLAVVAATIAKLLWESFG